MSTTEPATDPRPGPVTVIGRDVGWFGRVFRVVSGGLAVAGGVIGLATGPDVDGWSAVQAGGYVLGLGLFYWALHRGLGERVLARVDPFVGTVLVLAPLGVFSLSVFPAPLHVAVGIYIGVSLIVTALIGYGGCEVVALPTALSGRRYVVYCPINIVDAAERPLRGSRDTLGRAAAVLTLAVAGYFLLVTRLLDRAGLGDPVSSWWALVLLPPAGLLAVRAGHAHRHGLAGAFGLALGAAATAAGALVLAGLLPQDVVFAAAVLAGLTLAAYRALRGRRRDPGTPRST